MGPIPSELSAASKAAHPDRLQHIFELEDADVGSVAAAKYAVAADHAAAVYGLAADDIRAYASNAAEKALALS